MVEVPVWIFEDVQNLDGKIYTQDLINFILDKLKTHRLVFDSFELGPRSFDTVVCEVKDIQKVDNKPIALIEYKEKFKFLEQREMAIYFNGKPAPHINGNEQIFDLGDVIEPIVFSMVQLK